MRGAQLFLSVKSLTSVPASFSCSYRMPGIDRQPVGDAPGVLRKQLRIALGRRAAGVEVGARDAVDLPEVRVREDGDLRAGRGLPPVRRRERRAGALVDLAVVHVVVLEAALQICDRRRLVGRLERVLVVDAAVAGFVEADAACRHRRRHRLIGDAPGIDRRRLVDAIQRARERAFEQPAVVQRAAVATVWLWPP